MLDNVNAFIAMHRDRTVVPITLRVSKVSGLNEDSVFMGVMEVRLRGRAHWWWWWGGVSMAGLYTGAFVPHEGAALLG